MTSGAKRPPFARRSLEDLVGTVWQWGTKTATIRSGGRVLYDGEHHGEAHDLFEKRNAHGIQIYLGSTGWKVDWKNSSDSKLSWTKNDRTQSACWLRRHGAFVAPSPTPSREEEEEVLEKDVEREEREPAKDLCKKEKEEEVKKEEEEESKMDIEMDPEVEQEEYERDLDQEHVAATPLSQATQDDPLSQRDETKQEDTLSDVDADGMRLQPSGCHSMDPLDVLELLRKFGTFYWHPDKFRQLEALVKETGVHPTHVQISEPMQPRVLQSFDLRGIAKHINERKAKSIVVLCGAGISTSAGIPDFRTPGTGLYDNLREFDLPYPEALFDIEYFRQKPDAFYKWARESWPDKYKPTLCHYFIRLLSDKGLLRRCYTQNIDSLELLAGLPPNKLVAAHGSFESAHVVGTEPEQEVDLQEAKAGIMQGPEGWRALEQKYGGLVKPKIVFSGESLPARFWELHFSDLHQCDMLIVMGSSLQVLPFCGLLAHVRPSVPRLLVNKTPAGLAENLWFGLRFRLEPPQNWGDVMWEGDSDDGVVALAEALGWRDELEGLRNSDGRISAAPAPWVTRGRRHCGKTPGESQGRRRTKEASAKSPKPMPPVTPITPASPLQPSPSCEQDGDATASAATATPPPATGTTRPCALGRVRRVKVACLEDLRAEVESGSALELTEDMIAVCGHEGVVLQDDLADATSQVKFLPPLGLITWLPTACLAEISGSRLARVAAASTLRRVVEASGLAAQVEDLLPLAGIIGVVLQDDKSDKTMQMTFPWPFGCTAWLPAKALTFVRECRPAKRPRRA